MTNKEAIEFLKNMIDRESVGFVAPQGDGDVAIWQYHVEALNMAITALQAHWIPVTERLPEQGEDVLWSCHFPGESEFFPESWFLRISSWTGAVNHGKPHVYEIGDAIEIMAWMPLPEPYKEKE